MNIKTNKVVRGIPAASVAVTQGESPAGAKQVVVFTRAHDCYDTSEVVSSLRMSPVEARDYAARLLVAADAAEAL